MSAGSHAAHVESKKHLEKQQQVKGTSDTEQKKETSTAEIVVPKPEAKDQQKEVQKETVAAERMDDEDWEDEDGNQKL